MSRRRSGKEEEEERSRRSKEKEEKPHSSASIALLRSEMDFSLNFFGFLGEISSQLLFGIEMKSEERTKHELK